MSDYWRVFRAPIHDDRCVRPQTHLAMALAGTLCVLALSFGYQIVWLIWLISIGCALIFTAVYFLKVWFGLACWDARPGRELYLYVIGVPVLLFVYRYISNPGPHFTVLAFGVIEFALVGLFTYLAVQIFRLISNGFVYGIFPARGFTDEQTLGDAEGDCDGPYAFHISHLSQALLWKPVYPIDGDVVAIATAIGGKPWLPDGLQWPCDGQGVPLHFLAQIDLSSLPPSQAAKPPVNVLPNHPGSGTLFIFLRVGIDDDEIFAADEQVPCKVLYTESECTSAMTRTPPDDLPPLNPYIQWHHFLWDYSVAELGYAGARPNCLLPRVPLVAIPCLTNHNFTELALVGAGESVAAIKRQWLIALRRAEISLGEDPLDAGPRQIPLGFPKLRWPWLDRFQHSDDYRLSGRGTDVPQNYPWHWLQIERTALVVVAHLIKLSNRGGARVTALSSLMRHRERAFKWIELATGHRQFTAVDAGNRQAFQRWLQQMVDIQDEEPGKVIQCFREAQPGSDESDQMILIHHRVDVKSFMDSVLDDGFFMAWPYCVASGNQGMVPPEFICAMHPGHVSGSGGSSLIHQTFGELGDVYQDDPSEQGFVPLLQIASDKGANLCWGSSVGKVSFWIDPAALARSDFSDVVARFHY